MMSNFSKYIGIIGAGAAGLTAAETLRRRGYTQVTILERSDRAGGKCYSSNHEERSYELGAGIIAANNRTVLKLAKYFNVPIKRVRFGDSILLDVHTGQPILEKNLLHRLSTLRQLLFRYIPLVKKYHTLAQPGFVEVDPALCVPFSAWVRQHHLELIAKELAPFFTGFGYDYFDAVPAAYVLKYFSWETLRSFALRKIYQFPQGIQTLWTTIAEHHDVRYNTIIQHIERDATITITTTSGDVHCDELIITSPLDEALQFLDASDIEQALFTKIRYCDYRTYAIWLQGFPKTSGYLPGNYTSARKGHPVFWYQRHSNTNLYTWYVLGDWKMTDEHILKNIQQVVEQLGGTIERVQMIKHWKYFPHVSTDDMRHGYFDQLERLQGKRHTYYAGELLNFSTVGLSAEYAERLVERFFC